MNRSRTGRRADDANLRFLSNTQAANQDNISTCSSLCLKALELILSAKSPNSAVNCEIRLWQQVRVFKEESVIRYLNGFYTMLSDLLRVTPYDPYCAHPNAYKSNPQANLLLIYNVTIRLGDICRYLHRHQLNGSGEASSYMKLASSYYYKAHSLIPSRSHALHQLALIATSDALIQIYWYVRAIHAEQDPLEIAAMNLSQVVKKNAYTNKLIYYMFQSDLSDKSGESTGVNMIAASDNIDVSCITNWLIAAVLAIHCDRVTSTLTLILNEGIKALSIIAHDIPSQFPFHPEEKSRLFQALDVLLCYMRCSMDVRLIEDKLETLIQRTNHNILFILSQSDTFAITSNRSPALSHDKELQGFSPLSSFHSQLDFKCDAVSPGYELIILMKRIRDACNAIVTRIGDFKFPHQKLNCTFPPSIATGANGVIRLKEDNLASNLSTRNITCNTVATVASATAIAAAAASTTVGINDVDIQMNAISYAKQSQESHLKNTREEQFTRPSTCLPVTPDTTRVPSKVRSRNVALKSILSSE